MLWGARRNAEGELQNLAADVAVILADERPLRWARIPANEMPRARRELLLEWATASGVARQGDLDLVARLVENDLNERLKTEPRDAFVAVDPSLVSTAESLVRSVQPGGDPRLAYYLFRCFQRIAAYEQGGLVQWKAEWLRGAKTDPRAIPGASMHSPVLTELLRQHVLEIAKAHSGGTAGIATTYRLKMAFRRGGCDHLEAAMRLGLSVDAKGKLRRV